MDDQKDHKKALRLRFPVWVILAISTVASLAYVNALKGRIDSSQAAPAHVAQSKAVEQLRDKPTLSPARRQALIKLSQRKLARALALKDENLRQQKLERVLQRIESRLDANRQDSSLVFELLPLKIRVLVEQDNLESVQQAITMLYEQYRSKFGDQAYDKWLSDRVNRLRDPHNFKLAIMHLNEALKDASEPQASQGALLLGDIWLQEGYTNGSYDQAIEQYALVATQYETQHKDIADMARFRQAKALWWNGQNNLAKEIFDELGKSGDPAVMELAEHYLELSDIKYPPRSGK